MRPIGWGSSSRRGLQVSPTGGAVPTPLREVERWGRVPVLLAQEAAARAACGLRLRRTGHEAAPPEISGSTGPGSAWSPPAAQPAPPEPAPMPPAASPVPSPAPAAAPFSSDPYCSSPGSSACGPAPPPRGAVVAPAGAGFFVKSTTPTFTRSSTRWPAPRESTTSSTAGAGIVTCIPGVVRKDGRSTCCSHLRVTAQRRLKRGDTYQTSSHVERRWSRCSPRSRRTRGQGAPNQVILRAFPLQYIGVSRWRGHQAVPVAGGSGGGRAGEHHAGDRTPWERGEGRAPCGAVRLRGVSVAGMKRFKLKVLDPEEMAKNSTTSTAPLTLRHAPARKPDGDQFSSRFRADLAAGGQRLPETMQDVGEMDRGLDREGLGHPASPPVPREVRQGEGRRAVLERLTQEDRAGHHDKATEFKPIVGWGCPPGFVPSQTRGRPAAAGQAAQTPAKAVKEAKGEAEGSSQPSTSSGRGDQLLISPRASPSTRRPGDPQGIDVYPQQVLSRCWWGR